MLAQEQRLASYHNPVLVKELLDWRRPPPPPPPPCLLPEVRLDLQRNPNVEAPWLNNYKSLYARGHQAVHIFRPISPIPTTCEVQTSTQTHPHKEASLQTYQIERQLLSSPLSVHFPPHIGASWSKIKLFKGGQKSSMSREKWLCSSIEPHSLHIHTAHRQGTCVLPTLYSQSLQRILMVI